MSAAGAALHELVRVRAARHRSAVSAKSLWPPCFYVKDEMQNETGAGGEHHEHQTADARRLLLVVENVDLQDLANGQGSNRNECGAGQHGETKVGNNTARNPGTNEQHRPADSQGSILS